MKKKFLYIVLLSFSTEVGLLLVKNRPLNYGDPFRGNYYNTVGYPIPIVLKWLLSGSSLMLPQLVYFFLNVLFYFLIFSVIYFAYSKLFNKAKKK